jgi:hypothetical protein
VLPLAIISVELILKANAYFVFAARLTALDPLKEKVVDAIVVVRLLIAM